MRRRLLILAFVSSAAVPAFCQPALSTIYDSDRQIKLQGPVTRVEWVNPRAYLFLDVRDAAGTTANWAVDFGNPLELERNGWKQSALRIGDIVTVEGVPARGEARQMLAKSVVLNGLGKRLFAPSSARRTQAAAPPAPRWPDRQIRLGPAPGEKGYWGTASARVLVENTGAKIPMNDDGLLVNLTDADRVAPFLPWAKAVYEHRQRTLLRDDPLARCLPPGGPRQFQMPNGFQFVEQRELGRILVLLGGGDRNWRVIYMDGRPVAQGADTVLSYYGTSTGRWEKDTLVVESVGFNERFWMTNGGLPHTEALHLTERFTRTDRNTLKYEVNVNDPRTYTRPWTGGWSMEWVPGKDMEEYFCEDNAESTFLR
ncbi:MAG: hypothetical protein JO323_23490 [Acidobacteriia bacterium]|nr:hypothetical protein [Terriglobia bacterium]